MRHRHDRHRHGEPPELGREHPARVDDHVGLDLALVGDDPVTAPLDRIAVTRVFVSSAPARRAPSASANVSCEGST